MKCPNCQETRAMSCRGVWLDRGELDTLLERDAALVSGGARSPEHGRYRADDDDDDHYRRRRSFWRESFD